MTTLLICKRCGDKDNLKLIKSDRDLMKIVSIVDTCKKCEKRKGDK